MGHGKKPKQWQCEFLYFMSVIICVLGYEICVCWAGANFRKSLELCWFSGTWKQWMEIFLLLMGENEKCTGSRNNFSTGYFNSVVTLIVNLGNIFLEIMTFIVSPLAVWFSSFYQAWMEPCNFPRWLGQRGECRPHQF